MLPERLRGPSSTQEFIEEPLEALSVHRLKPSAEDWGWLSSARLEPWDGAEFKNFKIKQTVGKNIFNKKWEHFSPSRETFIVRRFKKIFRI